MPNTNMDLRQILQRLDGKGYPAYKNIRGSYDFGEFTLFADHIQGDPFASPSRFRIRLPMQIAGFPANSYENRSRLIALRDFLARVFASQCRELSDPARGSGKSGLIAMDMPGQEILERSSIVVTHEYIEARFLVGLPARGRRVLGRQAATMLCDEIPKIANGGLKYSSLNHKHLIDQLKAAEDADTLRAQLPQLGLVAFVADGAILPRRSGVDHRPLRGNQVVPFQSPASLKRVVTLPHAGKITGLGIPSGVTLIVGGGYHGKSTLLSALELGIYNHIPGDGRELVVADPTAVKIRAEDGRRVEGVDIRPFINNLPNRSNAAAFRTDNASGSTSQAANIIEALEVGARLLLLDEDTCATNLMIRDARMQELVEKPGEPITPFIDRVRQLADHSLLPGILDERVGVSTILVLGGSGDYFDVADTIIRMDSYVPYDVTAEARRVAEQHPTGRQVEVTGAWPVPSLRIPLAGSLNPRKGKREVSIRARALRAVIFGKHEIDLSAVTQLVDEGQVRAIGQALYIMKERFMQQERNLAAVIEAVINEIERNGLDALDRRYSGDYVAFRPYELAAALNRLRTLRVVNPEAEAG